MEFRDVVYGRRSIRGYKDTPVEQDLIREVLDVACRAVSGVNSQPWEFYVVTGQKLDEIREYNRKALREGFPEDRADPEIPAGVYRDRSRVIGKALLGAMDIAREDKERRSWWNERGYLFFDAPVVIYLLMDESLEETAYRLDMGCVAQNICLAAYEKGLGTCVADQTVTFQKGAREILGIPDNKRFVVGICLGYPDESFGANAVRTPREKADDITVWAGFKK